MKKIAVILLALMLVLSAAACGGNKGTAATKYDIIGEWVLKPNEKKTDDLGALYSFTGWGMAYIDDYINVAQAYGWFWNDGKLELANTDSISYDDSGSPIYTAETVYAPTIDKDNLLHLTDDEGNELIFERAFAPAYADDDLVGGFIHEAESGDIIYEIYPDGRALLIRKDLGWIYSLKWTRDTDAKTVTFDMYDSGMLWDSVTYTMELNGDTLTLTGENGSSVEFKKQ